ncbi:MAG: ATP-dependent zinc protease [Pseudomonadota bacterium]
MAPSEALVVGWREWLSLPRLGVDAIKAKVDTGARTSALHAFELTTEESDQGAWVHFGLHPDQGPESRVVWASAPLVDQRWVTDSGGHGEWRYVIETPLVLGDRCWPVEITLTVRDSMRFRMLLGRTAMRGIIHVDPGASYLAGPPHTGGPDEPAQVVPETPSPYRQDHST